MKHSIAPPRTSHRVARWLSGCALALGFIAAGAAQAQALPVSVSASGNHAEASVTLPGLPGTVLAEVLLDFEDAYGLSPSSLGASAKLVSLSDAELLARLPNVDLTKLQSSLPLLITLQPPRYGGLSFHGTGRVEVHTHALPYAAGSRLRLFKAPLGGAFYDITDEIAAGSVRARGTYGGFSQFLILLDLRPTGAAIAAKVQRLRDRVDLLPWSERAAFDALLDDVESALAINDYAAALSAADAVRSRAQSRAGSYLPDEWRATRSHHNHAGELAAGAATLRFSIAFMRDYGP
ncbi:MULTISPECIES: DUF6689 family protein [unclassified Lysobacter]|uniref:DUF6689 family protein n=1 Tax=unclassified Lysobacter TaxID=2635362 RepID=UPI001BE77828|nr:MULTISPECIES: DUF6689 family protein [unclassified Lysobacter]MBT2749109.1 hypothetical protein [Lysobacter sp. ISL-42]MBT2751423.1 hypothetical protein [Lysobacter sp. ISL-50]MBT2777364.1 hypothetical protein [Lysobacter sp. ISL-54]MBT2781559.1 hypothetical protein [Lysobacter sp. ISL-52]